MKRSKKLETDKQRKVVVFSLLGSRLERECALQMVLPGCAPIIEIIPVYHMKRKYTNITSGDRDRHNYCSCQPVLCYC